MELVQVSAAFAVTESGVRVVLGPREGRRAPESSDGVAAAASGAPAGAQQEAGDMEAGDTASAVATAAMSIPAPHVAGADDPDVLARGDAASCDAEAEAADDAEEEEGGELEAPEAQPEMLLPLDRVLGIRGSQAEPASEARALTQTLDRTLYETADDPDARLQSERGTGSSTGHGDQAPAAEAVLESTHRELGETDVAVEDTGALLQLGARCSALLARVIVGCVFDQGYK